MRRKNSQGNLYFNVIDLASIFIVSANYFLCWETFFFHPLRFPVILFKSLPLFCKMVIFLIIPFYKGLVQIITNFSRLHLMITFIFYPIIIILGVCSSYTDIKFKKIKNIHLLTATLSGLIIYAGLIISHNIQLNLNFYLNFFISLGIGFLLYYTNIWGAGDAKLFIVYCLLMPTNKHHAMLPFSSSIIFINIFLLSTAAILILSLSSIIKNKRLLFKEIFSFETLKKLANSFLLILGLGWLISFLTQLLGPYTIPLPMTLLLFFSYLFFNNFIYGLKNHTLRYAILATGLFLRFLFKTTDFSFPYLLIYFKKTFSYTLIFYILNVIFNLNKTEKKEEKIIPFAPFMFLGILVSNTDFIYWSMRILDSLRR